MLRFFKREQILIGIRKIHGPERDALTWHPPNRSTITGILHHPIYAGAYVFGRSKTDPSRRIPGKPNSGRRLVARDEWQVLIQDRLPAYISWEQWEKNQRRLKENSTKYGPGPARGSSVLAGRIRCGQCGARMAVSYLENKTTHFSCCADRMNFGEPLCQSFEASSLETLVVQLVLTALEPASVELSLQAAESIGSERKRIEKHHRQSLERATYDTTLARRRYAEVDPNNRLVAAELERSWESLLQVQRKAEEALNRFRRETPTTLTPEQRHSISELVNDFPALWHSASTTDIDRQSIVRSMIDHVVVEVVDNTERLSVTIHWASGFEMAALKVDTKHVVECNPSINLKHPKISPNALSSFITRATRYLKLPNNSTTRATNPQRENDSRKHRWGRFAACCVARAS